MKFRRVLPPRYADKTSGDCGPENPDADAIVRGGFDGQPDHNETRRRYRSGIAMTVLLLAFGSAFPMRAAEPAPSTPAAKAAIETGPALGWVFPVFTDKEGYHQITLRGSTARLVTANQIDVTGFSAVLFSGDTTERVDSVLISPRATFHPKEMLATGDSTVRLIRDDVEVTGRGWSYDDKAKRVSIEHDVRVTFHAKINDILK